FMLMLLFTSGRRIWNLDPPRIDLIDGSAAIHFDPHITVLVPGPSNCLGTPAVLADPIIGAVADDTEYMASNNPWRPLWLVNVGYIAGSGSVFSKQSKVGEFNHHCSNRTPVVAGDPCLDRVDVILRFSACNKSRRRCYVEECAIVGLTLHATGLTIF